MNKIIGKIKEDKRLQFWLSVVVIFLFAVTIASPFIIFATWDGDLHDLKYHLASVRSLSDAWNNGQFMSRIYTIIAQDFGYGTGIFYSMFPSAIAVIFIKVLGLSVNAAFFLEFVLLFFTSAFITFLFLRKVFKKNHIALIGACCYLFFPYNLVEIYVRFAFAEVFLMLVLPLIAWGLYELFVLDNYKKFLPLFITGCTLGLLFHFILMLYVFIFIAIYVGLNYKKCFKKFYFIPLGISSIIVAVITGFYYIPMLSNYGGARIEGMGADGARLISDAAKDYLRRPDFVPIWILMVTVYVIFCILHFRKPKKERTTQARNLFIMGTCAVISVSHIFPWVFMPKFLFMIQFSSRLFMINIIFTILMIAYIVRDLKSRRYRYFYNSFLMILIVVSFCYLCKVNGVHTINSVPYDVTGLGEHNGAGAGAYFEGPPQYVGMDYYPKNSDKDYVIHRANKKMIVATDKGEQKVGEPHLTSHEYVRDFANYQTLNHISFMAGWPENNSYVILNIPYKYCADIRVYQFSFETVEITSGNPFESALIDGYTEPLLKINLAPEDSWSKVVISYGHDSALKAYLRENPFEFLSNKESTVASDFIKTGTNYSVKFKVPEHATVELPTFYYKGYKLTYTTEDGGKKVINGYNGQNGFIEVNLEESGTLEVEYTGGAYIVIANVMLVTGILLFALTVFLAYKIPREKFTEIGEYITQKLISKRKKVPEKT